jgi:hypothetical protein
MSRWVALLVMTLAVALLVATAGCIEVKEKPPEGPFTIELEMEEMFFVDESNGILEGPHGLLETEIPHAHEGYAWDIEGLGEFEGTEVELPSHTPGVRKASYNIHFLEEENHTGLSVATVPDLSGIYFAIGDGIGLEEGDDDTQTLDLELDWGQDLTEIASDDGWTLLEFAGRLSEPMVVNVVHNFSNAGTVTYLVGVHVKSGDILVEDVGSIKINPGERHVLSYLDGELWVKIWGPNEDLTDVVLVFDGAYDDLPKAYSTRIGQLEWEGHVGEVEESPGFGVLFSVLSLAVIAALVIRHRR